jgi:hypothetical protein
MSYDLLVFEPSAAPREREDFLAWFSKQAEWTEQHSYDDPAVTSDRLRAWHQDMAVEWPSMNGPSFQEANIDSPRLTDYCIGRSVVYASFAWSEAENAYPIVRQMAVKHCVGFYDASGDEGEGEIYFPGDVLLPPSGGAWREVAKQFRELKDDT